jgi:hypothetical protein
MAEPDFMPQIVFGFAPLAASALVWFVTDPVVVWDRFKPGRRDALGGTVPVVVGALDQADALTGIAWSTTHL